MANAEKITELIDEKALEQWERFVNSLEKAQNDMAKAATVAATLNKNISKSGGPKDFDKAAAAAAKATEDLARKRAAAALAEERLLQAQMRTAQMVEQNLKRQAAEEEKIARERRASKRAEIQFEINAAKEKESIRKSEYDANMRLAVNENDLAKAREANSSTAISNLKTQTKETDSLTESIRSQNQESERTNDVLTQVSGTFEQLVRQNLSLRSELKGVQEELKELGNAGGKSRATLVQRELELKAALQESNNELRRASNEQNLAEGSSQQLSIRLDRLRVAWRGLSAEERDNTTVGKELEKQIKAIDKELKELDARVGVHNRKVGQYENATKDLNNALTSQFPILNALKREYEGYSNILTGSVRVLKQYIVGANSSAAATGKWSAALRILRIALISTGIGAIVVILGSLIAYLSSTAEGIDRVTAVTRPLQAIMRSLLGVLQNVGKVFVTAFTNPKQALEDLSGFLDRYILPQLRGVRDILTGIATLNFSSIKSGFEGIGRTVIRTGQDIGTFFGEAWQTGQQIDDLVKNIQDREIELIKTQGELNRTIQEQSEIARDLSKSESERKAASEAGLKAVNSLAEQQISLQEKRIELLKLENKDTQDTRSYLKELAEAEAELDNIRADAARKRVQLTASFNRATRQAETDTQRAQREAEKQARIQAELTERQYELTIQLLQVDEDRADRLAENHKRIIDDERRTQSERLNNLYSYLEARELAIDLAYEKEAADISKRLSEATKLESIGRKEEAEVIRAIVTSQLKALGEEENKVREDLRIEGVENLLKITASGISEELRLRQQALQLETQEREKALAEQFSKGSLSEQQYQLQRLKLSEDLAKRLIELEIETVQQLIEINKEKGIGVAEEERKLAELKMRLSRQSADAQIADAERVAEAEKELNSLKQELAKEVFNLGTTLFEANIERELQDLDRQEKQLEERVKKEIDAANSMALSEEEKQQRIIGVEKRAEAERTILEQKRRQAEIKQARLQKTTRMAEAVMSTAAGVARAFADYVFPYSAIIAGLVGALGAVQIATIASTPIPQYFRGVKSSPEGLAHVGEKGTELLRFPDGTETLTPNRDTLAWLPKGTEVLTNEQTKRYLAKQAMQDAGGQQAVSVDLSPLVKQQALTNAQLKKMQRPQSRGTILTRSGLVNIHKSGTKWSNYLKRNGL